MLGARRNLVNDWVRGMASEEGWGCHARCEAIFDKEAYGRHGNARARSSVMALASSTRSTEEALVPGGGQPRPIAAVMETVRLVRPRVVAGPVLGINRRDVALSYASAVLWIGGSCPKRAHNDAFERTAAHVTGFAKKPQTPRRAPTCRRSRLRYARSA